MVAIIVADVIVVVVFVLVYIYIYISTVRFMSCSFAIVDFIFKKIQVLNSIVLLIAFIYINVLYFIRFHTRQSAWIRVQLENG